MRHNAYRTITNIRDLEDLYRTAIAHRHCIAPMIEQWWAIEILKLRTLYQEGRARWLQVEPWIDKEGPLAPRLYTREELRIIDYFGCLYEPEECDEDEDMLEDESA